MLKYTDNTRLNKGVLIVTDGWNNKEGVLTNGGWEKKKHFAYIARLYKRYRTWKK